MIDRNDTALLEAWSAGGSEEAFAALARRYGGLLYHAAMRRTGRDDLAGEAAQNSLLILARKAPRLRHLPSLAGWLHRTACYEASKLLRRESRHQARMKHLPLPDDGDASWKDAAPLLDRALDELPEKDREVIFLKYFDQVSFEQMARQFGGEPAAWRQRGSRAVERLRTSLTKRGAAVSSAALTTGLGTSLSQAAPPTIAASLSVSPAAVAALSWKTLTLHSVHLMKLKPAAVIAATLLVSFIPLGMQASAISQARQRVNLLENGIAQAGSSAEMASLQPAFSQRTPPGVNLMALADDLMSGKQGNNMRRYGADQKIKAMDADELERLLVQSGTLDLGPEKRELLVAALFLRFCSLAEKSGMPCERVIALTTRLAEQMGSKRGRVWNIAGDNIKKWMNDRPEEALAWYFSSKKAGLLDDPYSAPVLSAHAFNALHRQDPAAALEFYRGLSDQERQALIAGGGGRGQPELMLGLAAEIAPGPLRGTAIDRVFRDSDGKSPEEVRAWLDVIRPTDAEAVPLLASAAQGTSRAMTVESVVERVDWLRETSEGKVLSEATASFLATIAGSNPGTFPKALDVVWERNPDEWMLAAYMGHCFPSEPLMLDVIPRSRWITNPELRDESLRRMLCSTRTDPEARELARKGGLSEEEINRLIPQEP